MHPRTVYTVHMRIMHQDYGRGGDPPLRENINISDDVSKKMIKHAVLTIRVNSQQSI